MPPDDPLDAEMKPRCARGVPDMVRSAAIAHLGDEL
jgi:hypothetical protein